MTSGAVNARNEAVIRLRLRGPTGTEIEFDAIVDTGFTASPTLRDDTVTALGLVRQSGGSALLGDVRFGSSAFTPRRSSGAPFGGPFWFRRLATNR